MASLLDGLNLPPEFKKYQKYIKYVPVGIVVLILAATSYVQIETEEAGVVTRFGKYSRTMQPGPHLKLFFLEKVVKVPIQRQQKLEFGYRSNGADIRNRPDESLMLTGDLNLADVEWVVQYRIDNPYNFLFKVRDPEQTLRDIVESATRQIVGDRTVDEVLTTGRAEIGNELEQRVGAICEEYLLGMHIEQIVLKDVNPPGPVRDAFNEVNQAQTERSTLIYNAEEAYNKVIDKADGEAQGMIQQAEGYRAERVNTAEGEVARFNSLYTEYAKAPEITQRRIYLEAMAKVLPKMGNIIITDPKGNNVLPLLQMQMQSNKQAQ